MFDTIETWITVDVDEMTAESKAATSTSAATIVPWAPVNSMNADAFVFTLFEPTIAPPDKPSACALGSDRDVDLRRPRCSRCPSRR